MKCPACGCNFMDDEKFCPMCEMRNNAFARAAHDLRRQKHTETFEDCSTVTCAHPSEDTARSTAQPARSSAQKKPQQNVAARIIKIAIGIFIALNFGLPLLFSVLDWFLYGGF